MSLIEEYAKDPVVPKDLRRECCDRWLTVTTIELPIDPYERRRFREALTRAFEAGWNSRKQNVDYALKNPEPRWQCNGQPLG